MTIIGLIYAQTRNVTGVITSNLDEKLVPEVTVRVKRGLEAVKSDESGRYSLNVPNKSSMVLIFNHPFLMWWKKIFTDVMS